ncbi:MAG: hypothetical protein MUO77_16435 [Anaerolineales bacterium]|nr:hypothetical protein [Anaerolineales bacterium]
MQEHIINNFTPEDLLEISKWKIQEKITAQQLAQKTMRAPFSKHWLATLGTWMVASGEKLQARYAVSLQTNQLEFSQHKARKTGA